MKKLIAIFYNSRSLKEGCTFTVKEKRILLRAIKRARKHYTDDNIDGLCAVLINTIYKQGYRGLYKALNYTYHTREYYNSKGLRSTNCLGYWWPIKDIKSRLKALDILKQAIIDD